MTIKRLVGMSAALLAGVLCQDCRACGAPGASAPFVAIVGGRQGADIEFQFSTCSALGHQFSLWRIAVYHAGDGPKGEAPICQVKTDASEPKVTHLTQWKYGAVPSGWVMVSCRALDPGEYDIEVSGAGSGVRRFSVAESGELRWMNDTCR